MKKLLISAVFIITLAMTACGGGADELETHENLIDDVQNAVSNTNTSPVEDGGADNILVHENVWIDSFIFLENDSGISFILGSSENKEISYDSHSKLFVKNDDQTWELVKPIIDDWGTDERYTLPSATSDMPSLSDLIEIDLISLYGELPNAVYKLQKEIFELQSSNTYDSYVVEVEFLFG